MTSKITCSWRHLLIKVCDEHVQKLDVVKQTCGASPIEVDVIYLQFADVFILAAIDIFSFSITSQYDKEITMITSSCVVQISLQSKIVYYFQSIITPDRRQSKTLLTIDEHGSKIAINSVLDCHLSPVGRQMAIENSVSNDFYLRSSIILTFRLPLIRCDHVKSVLRVLKRC